MLFDVTTDYLPMSIKVHEEIDFNAPARTTDYTSPLTEFIWDIDTQSFIPNPNYLVFPVVDYEHSIVFGLPEGYGGIVLGKNNYTDTAQDLDCFAY